MHINIKKPHRLKNMLDTAKNKIANVFTIIILYTAHITKIQALQRYSERLATKRINRLKHQLIKDRWELDNLNKAIDLIDKN